jgi:hypothetical protein
VRDPSRRIRNKLEVGERVFGVGRRMIIDAHVHLWDPSRASYTWLGPGMGDLDRTIVLDEILPTLRERGLDGVVLVQASDNAQDTAVMRETAAQHAGVMGMVAWSPLDDPLSRAFRSRTSSCSSTRPAAARPSPTGSCRLRAWMPRSIGRSSTISRCSSRQNGALSRALDGTADRHDADANSDEGRQGGAVQGERRDRAHPGAGRQPDAASLGDHRAERRPADLLEWEQQAAVT